MKNVLKITLTIFIVLLSICVVVGCGTPEQPACEHDYQIVDELVTPTCLSTGKAKTKCSKCGVESEKILEIDENNHVLSTGWYMDNSYHWHEPTCGHSITLNKEIHDIGEDDKCSVCGKDFTCNHEWSYSVITPSTCKTKGEQLKECTLCQEKSVVPLPLDPKNHTYLTTWTNDNEYHWHKTDCGHFGIKDYSKHYFGTDLVCDICNHKHVAHVWNDGVFNESTKHTKFTCVICSETKEELGLANVTPKKVVTNHTPTTGDETIYYKSKLSIAKSNEGKFIFRTEERTYYNPGSYNLTSPSNKKQFEYIGTLYPTEIYEAPYAFTADGSPRSTFKMGEYNASNMNTKIYNFIRFMYISTDGKLELSFEYDTSFIYKSPDVSMTVRGRFIVEKIEAGLTDKNNLNEFLTQNYVGSYDFTEFFALFSQCKFNYGLVLSEDNTQGLVKGDYVWCDINYEVPLISVDTDYSFWSYMLANTQGGQTDGMYYY